MGSSLLPDLVQRMENRREPYCTFSDHLYEVSYLQVTVHLTVVLRDVPPFLMILVEGSFESDSGVFVAQEEDCQ